MNSHPRARRPSPDAVRLGRAAVDLRDRLALSQRDVAERARVSQAAVWRLETGAADRLDLVTISAIFSALGGRVDIQVGLPVLIGGGRQHDAAHALLVGYIGRRLRSGGWDVRAEVQVQTGRTIGWIDTLAFRAADRACLVVEAKSDVDDIGGTQRQVQWYGREAERVASELGWRVRSTTVALLALDSARNAATVATHRELLAGTFPGRAPELVQWLTDGGAPPPSPALGFIDPSSRRRQWIRATPSDGRRTSPAYRDYADFMRRRRG